MDSNRLVPFAAAILQVAIICLLMSVLEDMAAGTNLLTSAWYFGFWYFVILSLGTIGVIALETSCDFLRRHEVENLTTRDVEWMKDGF